MCFNNEKFQFSYLSYSVACNGNASFTCMSILILNLEQDRYGFENENN